MAAVVIYLIFLFLRRDYIFAGVGVWALTGLSITHIDPIPPSDPIVLLTSTVGAIIISVSMVLRYMLSLRKDRAS